jgi:hypothetical protein
MHARGCVQEGNPCDISMYVRVSAEWRGNATKSQILLNYHSFSLTSAFLLAIFHSTSTENEFCVLSNILKIANFCDVMPCSLVNMYQ